MGWLRKTAAVAALSFLMAGLGVLLAKPAQANGCIVGEQVDRIIQGEINQDLVIADRVCIGPGTVNGDVFITRTGLVRIGGDDRPATINGDVVVQDGGRLTVRDTINGDVIALRNAKVDMALRAKVNGDVIHQGCPLDPTKCLGEVDFRGGAEQPLTVAGAKVSGDVVINGGAKLKASGPNPNNRVEGDIVCDVVSKVAGGTATNWDGKTETLADGTKVSQDGTIGGDYRCAKV